MAPSGVAESSCALRGVAALAKGALLSLAAHLTMLASRSLMPIECSADDLSYGFISCFIWCPAHWDALVVLGSPWSSLALLLVHRSLG